MDPTYLKKHVSEALGEYNENNAEMPLVLFEDAMKHVCRITRIIMSPSGHAAMIGVGGMGKQSLSRLGAYILGYTAYQIVLSTTYNMNDLKANIQELYFKSGVKDDGFLWIFTDGHIKYERFLIYLNDLLASGEIADLYT
jgi:dynein heavy chain